MTASGCRFNRPPGVPCRPNTGNPAGSPHSAKHRVRPPSTTMLWRLRVVSVMTPILAANGSPEKPQTQALLGQPSTQEGTDVRDARVVKRPLQRGEDLRAS